MLKRVKIFPNVAFLPCLKAGVSCQLEMKRNKLNLPYFNNCVNWDRDDVDALVDLCDNSKEITLATLKKNVDPYAFKSLDEYFASPLRKDRHVRYGKGMLHGRVAYFIIHSAIEYVFWK